MLMEIQEYFATEIVRIDTRDWDEVERIIKQTVKHPRSKASFATT